MRLFDQSEYPQAIVSLAPANNSKSDSQTRLAVAVAVASETATEAPQQAVPRIGAPSVKEADKARTTAAKTTKEKSQGASEPVRTRAIRRAPEAVLVGPKAAGLLGWDGFSPTDPEVWLVPRSGRARRTVIRTSRWTPSTRTINGYSVANDELVLAYLEESLEPLPRWIGDKEPISVVNRIELAVEWLLRNDKPVGVAALRATKTEQTVRRILLGRGPNEPPTESYAETRFIQQMRKFGITKVFRQIQLYRGDEMVNRIDIVIPFPGRPRPKQFTNHVGIPFEIDGKAFHVDTFEKDRRRGNEHSINQTRLQVVTTYMIERNPKSIYFSIRRIQALRRRATHADDPDYPPEPR